MPYKYNTKAFSLKERHPISRARFEAATTFIRGNQQVDHNAILDFARSLWEDK